MDAFRIQGGSRLSGRIAIDGSKNASLPLMAATLLTDEPVTLRGVPELSDVANMANLLGELGCQVDGTHGTIRLTARWVSLLAGIPAEISPGCWRGGLGPEIGCCVTSKLPRIAASQG